MLARTLRSTRNRAIAKRQVSLPNPATMPKSLNRWTNTFGVRREWIQGTTMAETLPWATLAPSTFNNQPWAFRVVDNSQNKAKSYVDVLWDTRRALKTVDPENREAAMACGAAAENIRIVANSFSCNAPYKTVPDPSDPNLLVRVYWGEPTLSSEEASDASVLMETMAERRTNREPFSPQPLPPELIDEMKKIADDFGVWADFKFDDEKVPIADLVFEAGKVLYNDKAYRVELSNWMRPSSTSMPDGMPGYALGLDRLNSWFAPAVVRWFNLSSSQPRKDARLAMSSAAILAVGTDKDDKDAWVRAGMAVQRMLVVAQRENVTASWLNQAIQVPPVRVELAIRLNRPLGYPQALLRLGYPTVIALPTPRRNVNLVLKNQSTTT